MSELVVEPASLQALARPLEEVGHAVPAVLTADAVGAVHAVGDVGLLDALDEFVFAWRHGLAVLGESVTQAGVALASAAAAYDAVDGLVADWTGR